jgi:hypothetical protein
MANINEELTEHRLAMKELDFQIRSNRPLIYICTHEETRVLDAIRAICNRDNNKKWEMYCWDLAEGLALYSGETESPSSQYDQTTVLSWFAELVSPPDTFQILILKDYYKLMGADDNAGNIEHEIVRNLRSQSLLNISKHKCIILIGTQLFLPPELEKLCAVIDWPLPERYHIQQKIQEILQKCHKNDNIKKRFTIQYSDNEMDEIVTAFQGLTLIEIELLCSYMVLTTNSFNPEIISNQKRDIIRKSGLVDWVDVENNIGSVGGLYELKDWLKKRKSAFTEEAREYGLPENPKGVLLVGTQGCGKSMCAQAIAKYWNLPLLRLDMGKIFAGIVGSSEENIRSAIKVAESIAPCIVLIDEIDKGLSGTGSSNNTDGGTAARVFGTLLNWMQEKKKPVFLCATGNNISQLPPELLRKGRFDEIFFVDLPAKDERKEIFKIHLEKRNRKLSNFDGEKLVEKTDGYTGAEIESIIISAMYDAFYDNKREITTNDLLNSIQDTVPLSITMKEHIRDLRNWAKTRARNASFSEKKTYNTEEQEEIEEDEDL